MYLNVFLCPFAVNEPKGWGLNICSGHVVIEWTHLNEIIIVQRDVGFINV